MASFNFFSITLNSVVESTIKNMPQSLYVILFHQQVLYTDTYCEETGGRKTYYCSFSDTISF